MDLQLVIRVQIMATRVPVLVFARIARLVPYPTHNILIAPRVQVVPIRWMLLPLARNVMQVIIPLPVPITVSHVPMVPFPHTIRVVVPIVPATNILQRMMARVTRVHKVLPPIHSKRIAWYVPLVPTR